MKDIASSSPRSNETLSRDYSTQGAETFIYFSLEIMNFTLEENSPWRQQCTEYARDGSHRASTSFRKAKKWLFTGAFPGTTLAGC